MDGGFEGFYVYDNTCHSDPQAELKSFLQPPSGPLLALISLLRSVLVDLHV